MSGRISLKATHALFLAFCIIQPLNVSADSPPNASAMKENPCPPALEVPRVLSEAREVQLNPKAAGVKSEDLSANPEVQAYIKAQRERAQGDWPNLCRYRQANGALSSPTRAVFMGDSLTENWVKADPSLFKQGIVGRGISGQTSPQMLLRFFQDVIDLHPQVVHIMAEAKHLAGQTHAPPEEECFKKPPPTAGVCAAHPHTPLPPPPP